MELTEVLRRRHMTRTFAPTPIAPDVLDGVLRAAHRAPAAGHTDALDLVVLEGPAQTARYWDVTLPPERRATFRWPGLLDAPVLIIPCVAAQAYVERYAEVDKQASGLGVDVAAWAVPYWYVDGGMAIMAMLLAATDARLGVLFFGIFDHEPAVAAALGIPSDRRPLGTIALGHPRPGEPGRSAARPQRAHDQTIHRGGW